MSAIAAGAERTKTRLDQWLWFARFVKSRSLAARLCAASVVAVNGLPVKKANHLVRIGDIVVLPQGGWQRTVRILALGLRRPQRLVGGHRGFATGTRSNHHSRPPVGATSDSRPS